MENACDEAGLEYTDLDKILLVGGSTRMPLVQEVLEEETGMTPSSEVHPDEAVAIGAAYHVLETLKRHKKKNRKTEHGETGNRQILNAAIPETTKNIHLQMLHHMELELYVRVKMIRNIILLFCQRIHRYQRLVQISIAQQLHFRRICIFR